MAKRVSDDVILAFYRGRCVACWVEPAVNIHEIEPRSKSKDWQEFDNRAPLCEKCHSIVHTGTATHSGWLRNQRDRLVRFLYSGDQAPPLSAP